MTPHLGLIFFWLRLRIRALPSRRRGISWTADRGVPSDCCTSCKRPRQSLPYLSYPLDLPALSTVSFSTMGVEAFLLLFLWPAASSACVATGGEKMAKSDGIAEDGEASRGGVVVEPTGRKRQSKNGTAGVRRPENLLFRH